MLAHTGVSYGSPPCLGWASARHLFKRYPHAMGPREGLCLHLTEYHAGPRGSVVRQSAMPSMAQYESIVQMLSAWNGPMQGLCLPLIAYYAGPRDILVWQSPTPLIGPYEPIVQMLLRPAEYYASLHNS